MTLTSLQGIQKIHLIGVAGTGMSAIAQYLAGSYKIITGSDRYFHLSEKNETQEKLEAEGIACFVQDSSGIDKETQLVVISTAIEESNAEIQKAKSLNIPIIKRAELLSLILQEKRGIAIGGTSGKSTTTAMLFDILEYAGLQPGIISGAGLVRLQEQGKIGNAQVGKGDFLVIEADESDGSIINYHPEIGILLNIDKDHKEISELLPLFQTFKANSQVFIVNASHELAATFSQDKKQDFSSDATIEAGYIADNFQQQGLEIQFTINDVPFTLHAIGKHNMENVLAAVCVANQLGVSLATCSEAITAYKGIYRRNQVLGKKGGIWVIDDYAHNPAKVAAAILGVQPLAEKVIAWFQPHGYGPTRFLRTDFVEAIAAALRPQDEIWMSEIFYAGGTAVKDISANDLIQDIRALGKQAFFVDNRDDLLADLETHFTDNCVLLLMGARDPSLDIFAKGVFAGLG
ncbi:UDP-N-acetylmuramate--L-alanine ligase [Parasediminibacterium sp. JCM 36343]|uniref:UDP-N-acetylmuramate--L-alanine ligase n=1 Tax=Parasediminibacterium sp. JCM 36343 TaxID=3374279 RepID=UPI00397C10F2